MASSGSKKKNDSSKPHVCCLHGQKCAIGEMESLNEKSTNALTTTSRSTTVSESSYVNTKTNDDEIETAENIGKRRGRFGNYYAMDFYNQPISPSTNASPLIDLSDK